MDFNDFISQINKNYLQEGHEMENIKREKAFWEVVEGMKLVTQL
jgi:hypothetical protein